MKEQTDVFARFTFANIIFVVVVLTLAWLLLRWSRNLFQALEKSRPNMRFLIRQAEPAFRILIWFLALLLAMRELTPGDTFLAALGSAAIAIGLGAQDLIKNLIGGLVIVTDRPYQIGDRVRVGAAYGEVEQIGLRSTKVMTPDDTLVTIPNADVLSSYTFNSNAGVPECMVVTQLFLPTNADANTVLRIGREVAIASPYTHLGRRLSVKVEDGFTEAPFMTLTIKAYVYDHRYEPAMQTDITRRCKKIFQQSGMLEPWLHGEE